MGVSRHVETVVKLSKGNFDGGSLERKSAAKAGDIGIVSGYSKGSRALESTNVKMDYSPENLGMSELRGKAAYEKIKDFVREQKRFRVFALFIPR